MKSIKVVIKEKDKGLRRLSLLNLRDEVVNFLYKDTVASSTKADLNFFVLLYFALVRVGDRSLIEVILDDALPKFDELNQTFINKRGYLKTNEYAALVEQHGLSEIFSKDLFFVLTDAILEIDKIDERFDSFYKNDPNLSQVMSILKTKYYPRIESSFEVFKSSKIRDDRYDNNGNYHDLSKSVYRTIGMRNSRNLQLNLQKYTKIELISSQSPIILEFIQYVDPQIIFDLWDKYHVFDHMKDTYETIDRSGILSGLLIGAVFKYASWKNKDGKKDRKGKKVAKEEFERSKKSSETSLEELNVRLVQSVLEAGTRLEKETAKAKIELAKMTDKDKALQDNDQIKKLEDRISRLENLEITAEVTDQ